MAKKNITQYIILGYLCHEPMTGYELKKKCEGEVSHFWSDISYGQIYPTLAKLEEQGLATKEVELHENGPPRKIYTITAEGRDAFKEWLQEAPAKEQVKYEILLKLFFGSQLPPQHNLNAIREFQQRSAQTLGLMEGYEENLRQLLNNDDHLYFLLVVMLGKHFYKAQLDWAEEAMQLLKDYKVEQVT